MCVSNDVLKNFFLAYSLNSCTWQENAEDMTSILVGPLCSLIVDKFTLYNSDNREICSYIHSIPAIGCLCCQVNVAMVMKTMKESGAMAARLILKAVPLIAREDWTDTRRELKVGDVI